MKVGLYFGSFNPIHNGHLAIAKYMVRNTDIDEIWFVVSPQNPLKETDDLLPDHQRLQMVSTALTTEKNLRICDIEFFMPRPSFTIDTINKLHELHPETIFVIIMGTDGLQHFNKWKEYKMLIQNYQRYIYPRPETVHLFENTTNSKLIDAPLMEISSTKIRNSIKNGDDITPFVPLSIAKIIFENRYYQ